MPELILDLTRLLPGPLATKLLQAMGFRILRIASPHGDLLQTFSPATHDWLNAGKEVETLDLKTPAGCERLTGLVRQASVLIESNLPGKMEAFGVGPERLREINPRLVYVRLAGYRGENAEALPGHDLTYLAAAGALQRLGPAWTALPVADVCGAFWAAMAVLQGLRQQGGFFEVYLAEAGLTVCWPEIPHLDGADCCYGIYAASAGAVALAALESRSWERFCAAAERPGWISFAFTPAKESNPVYREICKFFQARTAEEWDRWAAEKQLPLRAIRETQAPLKGAPWRINREKS